MAFRDIVAANGELAQACFKQFVAPQKLPFACQLVCLQQGCHPIVHIRSFTNVFFLLGCEFDQFAQSESGPHVGVLCRDSDVLFCGLQGASILWASGLSNVHVIEPTQNLGGLEFLQHCAVQRATHAKAIEKLAIADREAAAVLVCLLVFLLSVVSCVDLAFFPFVFSG